MTVGGLKQGTGVARDETRLALGAAWTLTDATDDEDDDAADDVEETDDVEHERRFIVSLNVLSIVSLSLSLLWLTGVNEAFCVCLSREEVAPLLVTTALKLAGFEPAAADAPRALDLVRSVVFPGLIAFFRGRYL